MYASIAKQKDGVCRSWRTREGQRREQGTTNDDKLNVVSSDGDVSSVRRLPRNPTPVPPKKGNVDHGVGVSGATNH